MSWADTAAVRAVIQTVPALATSTFVTTAPKATPPAQVYPTPYVVIHPHGGFDQQSRFTGPSVLENPSWTLWLVGTSAEQAIALVDLVRPKFHLNGFVNPPTVAGRSYKNGFWRSPIPLQSDTDVSPTLVYAVVELGWTSEPA